MKIFNDETEIPGSLKIWFLIHFVVDILFAIPLFVSPLWFLNILGWETIDPIAARMVAAALFGIGIESFLCRNYGKDAFLSMVTLKVIWSLASVTGLAIGLAKGLFGNSITGIILLATFILFNILWSYWLIRLKILEKLSYSK